MNRRNFIFTTLAAPVLLVTGDSRHDPYANLRQRQARPDQSIGGEWYQYAPLRQPCSPRRYAEYVSDRQR
jgi:hypothetical protein